MESNQGLSTYLYQLSTFPQGQTGLFCTTVHVCGEERDAFLIVSSGTELFLFQQTGLMNVRAFSFLVLWYIFSAFTLFLNKYILSTLRGDPMLLGKCGCGWVYGQVSSCVCMWGGGGGSGMGDGVGVYVYVYILCVCSEMNCCSLDMCC